MLQNEQQIFQYKIALCAGSDLVQTKTRKYNNNNASGEILHQKLLKTLTSTHILYNIQVKKTFYKLQHHEINKITK